MYLAEITEPFSYMQPYHLLVHESIWAGKALGVIHALLILLFRVTISN